MPTESDHIDDSSRQLRLLHVANTTLGLLEDELLKVVEWIEPTPLPFAPASVFGIVSVEGRMFTVVDVSALLDHEVVLEKPRFIVALRGDEQLALAVDAANETVQIKATEIKTDSESNMIAGKTTVRGNEVLLLNVGTLFGEIFRGRERRRRRL